jgi:hypothetical protein
MGELLGTEGDSAPESRPSADGAAVSLAFSELTAQKA